ncbi:MAG: hypothetical protein V4495_19965 [Pseudomonadota bacterium]
MNRSFYSITFVAALASICAGCSSFTTHQLRAGESNEGLVYFLPKKDVLITLTVASGKLTGMTFGTTTAYPDHSVSYVINHSSNGLAKNVTSFEIKNGLLTSTTGTTTSGVSDALKNLAASSAQLRTSRNLSDQKDLSVCGSDGNHTYRVLSENSSHSICGIKITIEKLAPDTNQNKSEEGSKRDKAVHNNAAGETQVTTKQDPSGIYYRQIQGMLVTGTGQGLNSASIVYVPAPPTYFLPAGHSFFANNTAEITLEDGVPTKFKRDADGEVIALLKLPADVIAAYFTAIGGVFDAFKTRDNKESAALQESLKLESVRQKYAVCLAAIKASDDDLISKLGCDKP